MKKDEIDITLTSLSEISSGGMICLARALRTKVLLSRRLAPELARHIPHRFTNAVDNPVFGQLTVKYNGYLLLHHPLCYVQTLIYDF